MLSAPAPRSRARAAQRRRPNRLGKDLVVGIAAGVGAYAFAAGGDSWGQGTGWQDAASTSVWPWLLIVATLALTASRWIDAVLRSTLAMALMVVLYYGLSGGLALEGNQQALIGWGGVAITVVPVYASVVYGAKSVVRAALSPPASRHQPVEPAGRRRR